MFTLTKTSKQKTFTNKLSVRLDVPEKKSGVPSYSLDSLPTIPCPIKPSHRITIFAKRDTDKPRRPSHQGIQTI